MPLDTLILYDSDFNPQADLQAIARAHRINSFHTHNLLIFRLISTHSNTHPASSEAYESIANMFSIEEHVYKRAFRKYIASKEVLKHGVFDGQSLPSSESEEEKIKEHLFQPIDCINNSNSNGHGNCRNVMDRIEMASFACRQSLDLLSEHTIQILCDRSVDSCQLDGSSVERLCIDVDTREHLQLIKLHYDIHRVGRMVDSLKKTGHVGYAPSEDVLEVWRPLLRALSNPNSSKSSKPSSSNLGAMVSKEEGQIVLTRKQRRKASQAIQVIIEEDMEGGEFSLQV